MTTEAYELQRYGPFRPPTERELEVALAFVDEVFANGRAQTEGFLQRGATQKGIRSIVLDEALRVRQFSRYTDGTGVLITKSGWTL